MNIGFQFGRVMLVLALSASLGLHWALLQTVAWTGMLISYSHAAGFAAGVSATFDGKHPCRLCLVLKKAREAENQPASQDQQSREGDEEVIAILTADAVSLRGMAEFQHAASVWSGLFEWSENPLKPPPRALVAALALLPRSHTLCPEIAQRCPKVVLPRSDRQRLALSLTIMPVKWTLAMKNSGKTMGGVSCKSANLDRSASEGEQAP